MLLGKRRGEKVAHVKVLRGNQTIETKQRDG